MRSMAVLAMLVFIYYMASVKEGEGTFCCWPVPTMILFTPHAKERMWGSANHQMSIHLYITRPREEKRPWARWPSSAESKF